MQSQVFPNVFRPIKSVPYAFQVEDLFLPTVYIFLVTVNGQIILKATIQLF